MLAADTETCKLQYPHLTACIYIVNRAIKRFEGPEHNLNAYKSFLTDPTYARDTCSVGKIKKRVDYFPFRYVDERGSYMIWYLIGNYSAARSTFDRMCGEIGQ